MAISLSDESDISMAVSHPRWTCPPTLEIVLATKHTLVKQFYL